jgi:hypothetical protein
MRPARTTADGRDRRCLSPLPVFYCACLRHATAAALVKAVLPVKKRDRASGGCTSAAATSSTSKELKKRYGANRELVSSVLEAVCPCEALLSAGTYILAVTTCSLPVSLVTVCSVPVGAAGGVWAYRARPVVLHADVKVRGQYNSRHGAGGCGFRRDPLPWSARSQAW